MEKINLIDLYINQKVFSDLSEEALKEKKELVLNDVMRL
jgi:hypothetical protein